MKKFVVLTPFSEIDCLDVYRDEDHYYFYFVEDVLDPLNVDKKYLEYRQFYDTLEDAVAGKREQLQTIKNSLLEDLEKVNQELLKIKE